LISEQSKSTHHTHNRNHILACLAGFSCWVWL